MIGLSSSYDTKGFLAHSLGGAVVDFHLAWSETEVHRAAWGVKAARARGAAAVVRAALRCAARAVRRAMRDILVGCEVRKMVVSNSSELCRADSEDQVAVR